MSSGEVERGDTRVHTLGTSVPVPTGIGHFCDPSAKGGNQPEPRFRKSGSGPYMERAAIHCGSCKGAAHDGCGGAVASSDMLRRSARCTRCGRKGATIQLPGWVGCRRRSGVAGERLASRGWGHVAYMPAFCSGNSRHT